MASIGVKINPRDHDTDTQRSGSYEDLPNGTYVLQVEDADVKESGSGTDRKVGINVAFEVIEPEEFKGRKMFSYINIEHPNPQAQQIGQADFAKLCRALSIDEAPDDTDDLKFISFTADVGMGKPSKKLGADGKPEYPAKNEIKKYHYPDLGEVPAAKVSVQPAPANDNRASANDNRPAAKPAAAAGNRPWGKK